MKQYATYLRVSTQRQGAQGLGISAQRTMCDNFIRQNSGKHIQEFMDVESGAHRDRKGLWDAIDYCKKNNCGLVIAKLDRLARDVEFTFRVINTGIDIHFTDMPVVNSMILGVFASVAQYEREMVSIRTKQALGAKRARGEKLGGAADKWRESFENKTQEQKDKEHMKKGKTRNSRHLEDRSVSATFKVLRNVFPEATKDEDPAMWAWAKISCGYDNRMKILSMMKDYKSIDPTLFPKWNFDDMESNYTMHKLASWIQSLRKSAITRRENETK